MNSRKTVADFVKKNFIKTPKIIITRENCKELKPTSLDLLAISQSWSLLASEIAFIGNSKEDALCGRYSKIKTFIV